jgi:hypothetical protein
MTVEFTREQIENLVNHLESHMLMHDIGFTDNTNHIASIYCAIQFGNDFMESVDKGEIKVYEND